jgi:hypothetical protein
LVLSLPYQLPKLQVEVEVGSVLVERELYLAQELPELLVAVWAEALAERDTRYMFWGSTSG